MHRRNFLATAGAGLVFARQVWAQAPTGPFTLPPLAYAANALEPHIDAKTMEIHHDIQSKNSTL